VTLNVVFDYYTQGNELKLPNKKKWFGLRLGCL